MSGSVPAKRDNYNIEIYIDYLEDPIKVCLLQKSLLFFFLFIISKTQLYQQDKMTHINSQSINIGENDEPHFNFSLPATRTNHLRPGEHSARVVWSRFMWITDITIKVAEAKMKVNVTGMSIVTPSYDAMNLHKKKWIVLELLNGNLTLSQNGTLRTTEFVSLDSEVIHRIDVNGSDGALLKEAAYFEVFWFIDCQYKGKTDDLAFTYKYTEENRNYNVEALIVASMEPVRRV